MENILITAICVIALVALVVTIYNRYIIPQKIKDLQYASSNSDSISALRNELQLLQEENKRMNENIEESRLLELKKYADKFDTLVKDIPMFGKVVDNKSTEIFDAFLKNNFFKKGDNKIIYDKYSSSIVSSVEAYNITLKLGTFLKSKITPLLTTPPRTDREKKDALKTMLEVAMICYDVYTTAFNNINAREKQKINVNLLYNTISKEQALAEAEVMTDRTDLTPLWIRVLKKTIEAYDVKESTIIFTGYRQ